MNKKQRLRHQADKAWFEKLFTGVCEVCGSKGNQVHHFFPKHGYPEVRYNLDNGINLCQSCHFKHHHIGSPLIHQTIIEKRGLEWYNRLKSVASKKQSSFQTLEYYNNKIKELS